MKINLYDIKEPVKIRFKPLKNGNKSIYLDIYFNGVRKTEYLRMYLQNNPSPATQIQNQNLLRIAEEIKRQRIIDLYTNKYNIETEGLEPSAIGKLSEYLLDRANRPSKYRTKLADTITYKDVKEYGDIDLKRLDREWVRGFIEYLRGKNLSQNTINHRYSRIKAVVNELVNSERLKSNPLNKCKDLIPKRKEGQREYLTIEEIQKVANLSDSKFTYHQREIKRAFLFSCFTGLRISDIKRLRWEHIKTTATGKQIEIEQQKTGERVQIPLNSNALHIIGETKGRGFVFHFNCPYTSVAIKKIKTLCNIDKNICFHSARHTFATLCITNGVDIFTTSKLLGHTSVKTTQIYAKVIESKRREAVESLPKIEFEKED